MDSGEAWTTGNPDWESVLLHELGHAIGLGHGSYGEVMYSQYLGTRRTLTAGDVTSVKDSYAPRPPAQTPALGFNNPDFANGGPEQDPAPQSWRLRAAPGGLVYAGSYLGGIQGVRQQVFNCRLPGCSLYQDLKPATPGRNVRFDVAMRCENPAGCTVVLAYWGIGINPQENRNVTYQLPGDNTWRTYSLNGTLNQTHDVLRAEVYNNSPSTSTSGTNIGVDYPRLTRS
jgi:hypothetical protein